MTYTSGVLARSELDVTDARLKRLLNDGSLTRVRKGWYALPGADPDALAARRIGGTITGPTLLEKYGVWLQRDQRLHVRVHPHAARVDARSACVHYLEPAVTQRDDLLVALLAMAHCCSLEALVTAIDSVLEQRLLRIEEIQPYAERHHRLRKALACASHGSQAGGETRLRLFLRAHNISHRIQVSLPDAGRVDCVVGDRLVIEIDGRSHHLGTQFETDRHRDFALMRQGYVVLRLSYRMLFSEWEAVQAGILEIVRGGMHRR